MDNISNLFEKLNSRFNGNLSLSEDRDAIYAKSEVLFDLLKDLKYTNRYIMLVDITAAEYEDFFEVVYHVMREDADVVRIKVRLSKDKPSIPTANSVWKAANVLEREVFDLVGIVFEGHDNLKRILCPEDFKGHPLRKDFKLDIIDRF